MVIDDGRFPGRQGRLLFAYLVAEQGRPVPRDELADALWGETPPASWDKALTGIVSRLRGLLTDHGGHGRCDGVDWRLRLLPPRAARRCVGRRGRGGARDRGGRGGAVGRRPREAAKAAAGVAASLLRQPFLPRGGGRGVGRGQAAAVRRYPRASALGTCSPRSCLRTGDAPEAVRSAEQTVALAPFRECRVSAADGGHVAAGNRAEALRVYERCRRLLADELGAYPSPETEAVYQRPRSPCRPKGDEPTEAAPEHAAGRGNAHGGVERPAPDRALVAAAVAALAARPRNHRPALTRWRQSSSSRPESVVKIDAATGKIVGVVPVGPGPGRGRGRRPVGLRDEPGREEPVSDLAEG